MLLISILEVVGTIAFAISGALIGIEKKLDLFGVIFLSITTAVGGGIFRDLVLGNVPPVAFVRPIYCFISGIAGIVAFIFYLRISKLKNIISLTDALGLGVFTALGSNAALAHNMGNPFIVISMGLITGIGGGILRDVFVKDIPFVFRKEIYAVASILGASAMYYSYGHVPHMISIYICFAITFTIRMLSVYLKLNLPVLKINKEDEQLNYFKKDIYGSN
jgi:uncharacterized membrane protein YeiH